MPLFGGLKVPSHSGPSLIMYSNIQQDVKVYSSQPSKIYQMCAQFFLSWSCLNFDFSQISVPYIFLRQKQVKPCSPLPLYGPENLCQYNLLSEKNITCASISGLSQGRLVFATSRGKSYLSWIPWPISTRELCKKVTNYNWVQKTEYLNTKFKLLKQSKSRRNNRKGAQ